MRKSVADGVLVCVLIGLLTAGSALGISFTGRMISYLGIDPMVAAASPLSPGRLSQAISVQALGAGTPFVQLSAGRALVSDYTGNAELRLALLGGSTASLALSSADFDEDGIPDLLAGYEASGGGLLVLHRGNEDAVYPDTPDAQLRRATGGFTESPFLTPGHLFRVPEAPDFLAAGDFDADGHWDAVAAARDGHAYYLLRGDGRGGFVPVEKVSLPGRITFLAAGEVGRADGLSGIAVAIAGARGPQVLLFTSSRGAVGVSPAMIALPEAAAAVQPAQLDPDADPEIAVAAGQELLIFDAETGAFYGSRGSGEVAGAGPVARHTFSSRIRSLAVGDFLAGGEASIAALLEDGSIQLLHRDLQPTGSGEWSTQPLTSYALPTARCLLRANVSSLPGDDLVVLDPEMNRLHLITRGDPLAVQEASKSGFPVAASRSLLTFQADGQPVAVRAMRLNGDALSDLVVLRRTQSAPVVLTTVPPSTITVLTENDAGIGSLRQAIIEANTRPGPDRIRFDIPGAGIHTIATHATLPAITEAVLLDATTQPGYAGSPVIELAGQVTGGAGLSLESGSSVVRGLAIHGFDAGIRITGARGNIVEGNFIGTDATGRTGRGNRGNGVELDDSGGNTVGGATAAARNLISGNQGNGIEVRGDSSGNTIAGNYIGTDVTGTMAIGNTNDGIHLSDKTHATAIGGREAGAGNLLSGNGRSGVLISGFGSNRVQGNRIGIGSDDGTPMGNGESGVAIAGSSRNVMGGAASGNTIAYNRTGVAVESGSANTIRANSIYANDLKGIDLSGGGDGSTAPGSAYLQDDAAPAAPELLSATMLGSSMAVQGSLTGLSSDTLELDFFSSPRCDPGGSGEGKSYLGSGTLEGSSGGDIAIDLTLAAEPEGAFLTSTATDSAGSTSEFSNCTRFNLDCIDEMIPTSASFSSAGGPGHVYVTASFGCPWTANSNNADWIKIVNQNDYEFNYQVEPNTGPARTGTISVGTLVFTVQQAEGGPSCTYTLDRHSATLPASGGTGSVTVTPSAPGCAWTAVSNVAWITVTSTTAGGIDYQVAPSTGPARTGTMTIAGQTFTVDQGVGNACTYQLSPDVQTVEAAGKVKSLSVLTPDGCPWIATSDQDWILWRYSLVIYGTGTISYPVAYNPGPSRTGTITVTNGVQTVGRLTVQQAAGPTACNTSVSPQNIILPATKDAPDNRGYFAINSTCIGSWIDLDIPWLEMSSSGYVQITQDNIGPPRTASIDIFGQIVTVTQAGICPRSSYVVSPHTIAVDRGGSYSEDFRVFAPAECSWKISTDSDWINLEHISNIDVNNRTGHGSSRYFYEVKPWSDYPKTSQSIFSPDHRDGIIFVGPANIYVRQTALDGASSAECIVSLGHAEGAVSPQVLETSRRFRDDVMSQSDLGREYTELYYKFSGEASRIVLSSPTLLWRAGALLEKYHPLLETVLSGGNARPGRVDLDEVENFLSSLENKAGADLNQAIRRFKRDMRDPAVQRKFGIYTPAR